MRQLPATLGVATLLVCLGACASEESDTSSSCAGDKCDSPTGNGATLSTFNGNVRVLGGYHLMFDKTTSSCVVPSDGDADVTVGAVSAGSELAYVSSREELARSLGLDLGMKVKYGPVGNASVGFELLEQFNTSSRSVNLLLKLQRHYRVATRDSLELTDVGKQKLEQGIDGFVQTCGINYVNGVRFGSHLYLLITYNASDEDVANTIKASLGFNGGMSVVDVDGDLEYKLQETAKRSDVNLTIRAAAQGFSSSVEVAAELSSGITEETFRKIDQLRGDMDLSIAVDLCRDAGDPDCGGQPGPGYYENNRRLAIVTGVDIGFYDTMPSLSAERSQDFRAMHNRLLAMEHFIRGWAELEERMRNVFWSEIRPYMTAPDKGAYNLAPPAGPTDDLNVLAAESDKWMEQYWPTIGGSSEIGWKMQVAVDAIKGCWNNASVDLFHECLPEGVDEVEDTAEWQEVEASLYEYAETGRIVPLKYRIASPTTPGKAEEACRGFNTQYTAYRLPTEAELPILSILVQYGAVNWEGDELHEIWFRPAADNERCEGNLIKRYVSYLHRSGEEAQFECSTMAHKAVAICVPTPGPMPRLSLP